jgi:YesN/AraC family two-component response regulator
MLPTLYQIVEKHKLCEILESFHVCINLPIQILDPSGIVLESYGRISRYCHLIQTQLPHNNICTQMHRDASQKSIALGETYIFSCHANLIHMVFPLINQNTLYGSVLVGPFLMDEPDSTLVLSIDKKYNLPTKILLDLYEELDSIKILPSATVTHISRLLYYLFADLISESKQQLILNQSKLSQQSRINESIQMFKAGISRKINFYPIELENALITKVTTGNIKEAKALLNDILGYVFFAEGHSLEIVKIRSIELCSLLSRAAIKGGATSDSILKINNQYLKSLQTMNSLEELCFKLQESIDTFSDCIFNYRPNKNSELIKNAIHFIAENFSTPLSLEQVAKHVHLNSAYFSTLFKRSTGSSFKEYLNMIRIEESKRLLANTNYSVIDIAIATGFEDQSYFSKVFKKHTGLTPKQYR